MSCAPAIGAPAESRLQIIDASGAQGLQVTSGVHQQVGREQARKLRKQIREVTARANCIALADLWLVVRVELFGIWCGFVGALFQGVATLGTTRVSKSFAILPSGLVLVPTLLYSIFLKGLASRRSELLQSLVKARLELKVLERVLSIFETGTWRNPALRNTVTEKEEGVIVTGTFDKDTGHITFVSGGRATTEVSTFRRGTDVSLIFREASPALQESLFVVGPDKKLIVENPGSRECSVEIEGMRLKVDIEMSLEEQRRGFAIDSIGVIPFRRWEDFKKEKVASSSTLGFEEGVVDKNPREGQGSMVENVGAGLKVGRTSQSRSGGENEGGSAEATVGGNRRWKAFSGVLPYLRRLIGPKGAAKRRYIALETRPEWSWPLGMKELDLSSSRELQTFPYDLSELTGLERLVLRDVGAQETLPGLGGLTGLKELDLTGCGALQTVPDLGGLTGLERLVLRNCVALETLPGLGGLTGLKELDLTACGALQTVPDLGGLTGLERLVLSWCKALETLPGLGCLKGLKELDLSGCEALQTLPGLGGLTGLERLLLGDCGALQTLPDLGGLTGLERLVLSWCKALETLPGLGCLKGLKELDLSGCGALQTLPDLGGLTGLERLVLRHCEASETLSDLGGLKGLKELDLSGRGALQTLPDLGGLTGLERLVLRHCGASETLPALGGLKGLKELDLIGCKSLKTLPDLGGLTGLERLFLDHCGALETLPDLGGLKGLKELELNGCGALQTVPGLGGLTGLERLVLRDCGALETLPDLGGLKGLKELDLIGCESLKTVPGLDGLTGLKSVGGIGGFSALETQSDLSGKTVQTFADLSRAVGLRQRPTQKKAFPELW